MLKSFVKLFCSDQFLFEGFYPASVQSTAVPRTELELQFESVSLKFKFTVSKTNFLKPVSFFELFA